MELANGLLVPGSFILAACLTAFAVALGLLFGRRETKHLYLPTLCGFCNAPLDAPAPWPHICPQKPAIDAREGAAVAFAIIGMAEAIRANDLSRSLLRAVDAEVEVRRWLVDTRVR